MLLPLSKKQPKSSREPKTGRVRESWGGTRKCNDALWKHFCLCSQGSSSEFGLVWLRAWAKFPAVPKGGKKTSAFQLFPNLVNDTTFHAKQSKDIFSAWKWVRNRLPWSSEKDPPPQKSDPIIEENFLFQIPAFLTTTNKDNCSKIIAAGMGVTLLA